MFAEIFKESDRFHDFPSVDTTQQMEDWNHFPHGYVVIDTEAKKSDNKDSVMRLLIYLEDSDNEESMSEPPSADLTPEPGPPSRKPTKESTS